VSARRNSIKVWPHLGIVFIAFALLGGVAAALWMRHEPKAEALALPHAARVERVDGEVGLSRSLSSDATEPQWVELTPNTPLTVGDRVYAREDSRASLAFTGRNFARLEPSSSLDVLSLSDRRTQLALRDGSAIFNIGALQPGELFEVATPYGAVDFREPGLYQMGYNDDGSAFVSVLSGLAQVVGLAGSGQIGKGEMLTLLGQTAAQLALSRLSPDYAGGLVDDYYGYQYPDIYDGRYSDYNAYLNDPYHYDPYNRYASYRYVPDTIPGAYDLDRYGDWQNLNGYGYAWSPRADAAWAPYQQGQWMMDDPYGLTWVSNEPWGYAPYHYGRWVNVDQRWYWVPDGGNMQPSYSPALVAFVPFAESNQIGWLPLAPGDAYAPAYYDAQWQPHYTDGSPVLAERILNMGVPGALTVVSVDDFNRLVERGRLARVRPEELGRTRPVLDPLSHAMLRQASLGNAIARRGFVLPPGLAKRLDATQVYASARPATPFRDEMTRRFRVEEVPEKQKGEKLKFKDEREADVVHGPRMMRGGGGAEMGPERQQRRLEKAQERAARREDFVEQRQQQPQARAEEERAQRAEQRAQAERVSAARQAQKHEERQRAAAAEQQQRAVAQQQAEARRQAAQEAAHQRAQQAAAHRAQQQERARVKQSHQRPAAQAPQGHGRQQGPPAQAAKPHGQGHGGGGGGGKGNGGGGGKGKGKP